MAINPFKVILTSICIFQLIWMPVPVQAQEMVGANVSSVAPLISQTPFHLQGLRVYPDHQTRLQFLFSYDNTDVVADRDMHQAALKQVKFFLTALALPPEDAWVNLSPNEPDRIISDELGKTDMGKDMLAQDYVLKQITSALLSPEGETGRAFWDKIYDQLRQRGISEIPAETFHKVWIVPEKVLVKNNESGAFIAEASLDIMLADDYKAFAEKRGQAVHQSADSSQMSADDSTRLMKEVIIPVIKEEVNKGASFKPLRDIYDALILATWFRWNLKENILNENFTDGKNINGLQHHDSDAKNHIYQAYLKAFHEGVSDVIKEEYDPVQQTLVPRHYFTGGTNLVLDEGNYDQAPLVNLPDQGNFFAADVQIGSVSQAMMAGTEDSQDKKWKWNDEGLNEAFLQKFQRQQKDDYDYISSDPLLSRLLFQPLWNSADNLRMLRLKAEYLNNGYSLMMMSRPQRDQIVESKIIDPRLRTLEDLMIDPYDHNWDATYQGLGSYLNEHKPYCPITFLLQESDPPAGFATVFMPKGEGWVAATFISDKTRLERIQENSDEYKDIGGGVPFLGYSIVKSGEASVAIIFEEVHHPIVWRHTIHDVNSHGFVLSLNEKANGETDEDWQRLAYPGVKLLLKERAKFLAQAFNQGFVESYSYQVMHSSPVGNLSRIYLEKNSHPQSHQSFQDLMESALTTLNYFALNFLTSDENSFNEHNTKRLISAYFSELFNNLSDDNLSLFQRFLFHREKNFGDILSRGSLEPVDFTDDGFIQAVEKGWIDIMGVVTDAFLDLWREGSNEEINGLSYDPDAPIHPEEDVVKMAKIFNDMLRKSIKNRRNSYLGMEHLDFKKELFENKILTPAQDVYELSERIKSLAQFAWFQDYLVYESAANFDSNVRKAAKDYLHGHKSYFNPDVQQRMKFVLHMQKLKMHLMSVPYFGLTGVELLKGLMQMRPNAEQMSVIRNFLSERFWDNQIDSLKLMVEQVERKGFVFHRIPKADLKNLASEPFPASSVSEEWLFQWDDEKLAALKAKFLDGEDIAEELKVLLPDVRRILESVDGENYQIADDQAREFIGGALLADLETTESDFVWASSEAVGLVLSRKRVQNSQVDLIQLVNNVLKPGSFSKNGWKADFGSAEAVFDQSIDGVFLENVLKKLFVALADVFDLGAEITLVNGKMSFQLVIKSYASKEVTSYDLSHFLKEFANPLAAAFVDNGLKYLAVRSDMKFEWANGSIVLQRSGRNVERTATLTLEFRKWMPVPQVSEAQSPLELEVADQPTDLDDYFFGEELDTTAFDWLSEWKEEDGGTDDFTSPAYLGDWDGEIDYIVDQDEIEKEMDEWDREYQKELEDFGSSDFTDWEHTLGMEIEEEWRLDHEREKIDNEYWQIMSQMQFDEMEEFSNILQREEAEAAATRSVGLRNAAANNHPTSAPNFDPILSPRVPMSQPLILNSKEERQYNALLPHLRVHLVASLQDIFQKYFSNRPDPFVTLSGGEIPEEAFPQGQAVHLNYRFLYHPNPDMFPVNPERLPFENSQLENVMVWDMFKFLSDIRGSVRELNRTMAQGGRVAIIYDLNQHISFASINIFDDEMFVPVESKQIYYGQYLYNFVRIRPDSMKKKLDALIQYAKSKGSTSLSLGLFKDIWSSAGVSDISNSLSDQLRRNRNETLSVEDLWFLRQYIENPQEAFHVLHEKLTRARDMARYKKILDILQVSDDKDQFGFLELFEYVIARVFREEGFVRLNIKSGNDFEVFDRISTVEPGDLFPRGKIFTIQNQDVVLRDQTFKLANNRYVTPSPNQVQFLSLLGAGVFEKQQDRGYTQNDWLPEVAQLSDPQYVLKDISSVTTEGHHPQIVTQNPTDFPGGVVKGLDQIHPNTDHLTVWLDYEMMEDIPSLIDNLQKNAGEQTKIDLVIPTENIWYLILSDFFVFPIVDLKTGQRSVFVAPHGDEFKEKYQTIRRLMKAKGKDTPSVRAVEVIRALGVNLDQLNITDPEKKSLREMVIYSTELEQFMRDLKKVNAAYASIQNFSPDMQRKILNIAKSLFYIFGYVPEDQRVLGLMADKVREFLKTLGGRTFSVSVRDFMQVYSGINWQSMDYRQQARRHIAEQIPGLLNGGDYLVVTLHRKNLNLSPLQLLLLDEEGQRRDEEVIRKEFESKADAEIMRLQKDLQGDHPELNGGDFELLKTIISDQIRSRNRLRFPVEAKMIVKESLMKHKMLADEYRLAIAEHKWKNLKKFMDEEFPGDEPIYFLAEDEEWMLSMADGDYKDRLKPLLMMDLEKQPKNLLVYNYFPKMSDDFMNLLKSNHAKVLSIWETDFPRHSSEMSLEGYSVLKVPYKLMGEADSEGYYYISDNFFRGENAEIIREGLQADVQSYQKSLEFLLKESQEITQLEKSRSRDAKRSKGQVQHVAPVKTQSGHTASDVKRGLENTRADLKLLQTTVIPLSNQLIQFVEQGGDLQQRFDQWNNRPDMIKNFRHLMTYLDEPTPSLPMAFSASVEQFKYDQFGADIGEGVETVMDYEDLSKQQLISISAYVRSNQARHFLFVGAFAFPVSEEFAQAQGFVDSILNDKIRVMLQYYKMVASFDVEVGDKKVGSDSAMVSKNPEPTGGVDFAALNQMFGEQNSQLSAVDLGMDREKAWFGVKPIVISIDVVKDLDDFFNGQHIPKPAGPQFSAVSDIVGIKNW